MSYLAKLRELESEKATTPAPTKPTEGAFVGSVGAPPAPVGRISGLQAVASVPPAKASATEVRRSQVEAMLAARPGIRYALVTDEADEAYPGCVVLGIGIRGENGAISTADLIVPRESYDGYRLLELVERHTEGTA